MSFRDTIMLLDATVTRQPRLRLPETPLREASEVAANRFLRERTPVLADADLRALHARCLRAAQGESTWDEISKRDWRNAGQVIWQPAPALVGQPAFLAEWEGQLAGARSARPWKRLIHSYLRDFDLSRPELYRIADWIAGTLETGRFAALEFWREKHRHFRLFSPADGPQHLGEAMLRAPRISIEHALTESGLDGELRDAGFATAAWRGACAWLQGELQTARGARRGVFARGARDGDGLRVRSSPVWSQAAWRTVGTGHG